jgi:hypothetical protein
MITDEREKEKKGETMKSVETHLLRGLRTLRGFARFRRLRLWWYGNAVVRFGVGEETSIVANVHLVILKTAAEFLLLLLVEVVQSVREGINGL